VDGESMGKAYPAKGKKEQQCVKSSVSYSLSLYMVSEEFHWVSPFLGIYCGRADLGPDAVIPESW
jgi:hypothetical protein